MPYADVTTNARFSPVSDYLYAPLSIKYTQAAIEVNSSSIRFTLYEVFQKFGSYLAFVVRFSGMVIGGLQSHAIDNSMIKKLYSSKPDDNGDDDDDDGA